VAPRSDARLNAMLTVLEHLMRRRLRHKAEARRLPPSDARRAYHDALQGAVKILINSFYGSLGNAVNLFADADAAAEVTRRGRDILVRMLSALEERGMELIEADTDGVIFAAPEHWTEEDERRLVAEVSALLPEGINIEHDGRWARMYSYMEKNYALLGYDGTLTIKGSSFRSSRNEFYGERFFRAVLPLVMSGDMAAARALYLETVRRIRTREMPVRDLCISTRLTKSPEEYRAAGRKEEPYEVMRAARRRWAVGDRIVYYQASRGRRKLLEQFADDYDVEYYVRKLTDTYCARLSKAIPREHFAELFGEQLTLFATPPEQIAPLVTVENTLDDLMNRML
jgi:DNA polymerase elongation subunit (family B)